MEAKSVFTEKSERKNQKLNNKNKNVIITTILKQLRKEREDDHFTSFIVHLCRLEWDI